jgi:hypothetical protein
MDSIPQTLNRGAENISPLNGVPNPDNVMKQLQNPTPYGGGRSVKYPQMVEFADV